MKAIKNAIVITEDKLVQDKLLVFSNKLQGLVDVEEADNYPLEEIIDAKGNFVAPGFIDIHIHGGNGYDTMDSTENALQAISCSISASGVTSFLPTTMTMSLDNIYAALECISGMINKCKGAAVLGAHLEGPFISRKYKGAQYERFILEPSFEIIENYKKYIKIVTLAPELSGSMEFISSCVNNGINVSLGHTEAEYDQVMNALAAGAKCMSHTFNAMSPLNHRKPGAIGAALDGSCYCELIADNIHVHPAVQRLLLKAKSIDRIILVSDAIRASMLVDGEYELGGQTINVKNGVARLRDGTLAGSTIALNKALKNFIDNTGINIVDAVKLVSKNPAKLLGISDKGAISAGKDADLVIFDKNINIIKTIVMGKEV